MSYLYDKIIDLKNNNKIYGPEWLFDNAVYVCQMGSVAYGVSNNVSDIDVYGITIPPLSDMFPHLRGDIMGFSTTIKPFGVYSHDHIINDDCVYDVAVYGIIKYFRLLLDNNPNIIDSIFVPDRCVLHIDDVGTNIRNNRHEFLSNKIIPKIKGYAYSQLSNLQNKKDITNPKRKELVEKFGYDVKFAYQCVRILLEGEQIVKEGTLDIEKNSELLIGIRNGEWTFDYFEKWVQQKLTEYEDFQTISKLPVEIDESIIKSLLMECIEMKYGSISKIQILNPEVSNIINDMQLLIKKYTQ